MSSSEKPKQKFSLASILTIRKKPKKTLGKEEKKLSIERVMPVEEPLKIVERDQSWRVLESYYVYKPFVKITIAETPTGPMYFVEEQGLTPEDKSVLSKLAEILMDEIHPPSKPEDIRDLRAYVFKEVERIAEKYRDKLGLVGARRIKVFYYVERNLLGYGAIDPFLRDPNIEDLSCNGVNVPIFVWHRKYESIPSNISFLDEEYLNELIMKLAHMSGKHISIAYPVLDAMLPEKHRVAATYGHEVSVKGPSFTIR
ncbi:MAG: protein kinase, partial [Thermosphaera sp.]